GCGLTAAAGGLAFANDFALGTLTGGVVASCVSGARGGRGAGAFGRDGSSLAGTLESTAVGVESASGSKAWGAAASVLAIASWNGMRHKTTANRPSVLARIVSDINCSTCGRLRFRTGRLGL